MCTKCRIGHAGLQQMATQKMARMASNSVEALEATRDGATAACDGAREVLTRVGQTASGLTETNSQLARGRFNRTGRARSYGTRVLD